eukprot:TRINITY_DN1160_c0_g1_i1.p2 TRINITY_DN1160_c0_g1~~TRINITY_DN1160_c0_g1_i1.p2  ORF type:complete len:125 (-),score=17.09 TRINITY_DN1160_c0_g1_i1:249-623(-)
MSPLTVPEAIVLAAIVGPMILSGAVCYSAGKLADKLGDKLTSSPLMSLQLPREGVRVSRSMLSPGPSRPGVKTAVLVALEEDKESDEDEMAHAQTQAEEARLQKHAEMRAFPTKRKALKCLLHG